MKQRQSLGLVPVRGALVLVICLVIGAGSHAEQDSGIRITAPLDDWAQPQDLPVAIAFFSMWPPCSARTSEQCAGDDIETCENSGSRQNDGEYETHLLLDGRHILTHVLTAENQFAFSGVLPARSLHLGEHQLSVKYTCADPDGNSEQKHGHSTKFSVVDTVTWEELGQDGEEEQHVEFADRDDPLRHAPDASVNYITGESRNLIAAPSLSRQRNIKCSVIIYHAHVMKVSCLLSGMPVPNTRNRAQSYPLSYKGVCMGRARVELSGVARSIRYSVMSGQGVARVERLQVLREDANSCAPDAFRQGHTDALGVVPGAMTNA